MSVIKKNYFCETQGAVAVIFSLVLSPLVMLMSASLDFSQAAYIETKLAYACDAASIACARYNLKDSVKLATSIFSANYVGNSTGKKSIIPEVSVSKDQITITVTGTDSSRPFIGLFSGGSPNMVNAVASTQRLMVHYELAMVLDVTGSMASNGKMKGLIDASNQVVDILNRGETVIPNGLISIVPYVACVNIGVENVKWVYPNPVTIFPLSTPWQGCVMARPGNLNDTEAPPSKGLWPIYYAASTYLLYPGQKGDNDWYINAKGVFQVQNPITGYAIGPNRSCGPSLVPLTTDVKTLKAKINSFAPINGGGTIGSEGVAWGWYTISPLWRGFWNIEAKYPQDYKIDDNQKMMIIVTDGTNTWYNTPGYNPDGDPTAYGRVWEGQLGTTDLKETRDIIDKKVINLCNQMKEQGVVIYTILFMVDDDQAKKVYQQCASEPAYAFQANTVTNLYDQLGVIAQSVQKIRIIK